MALQHDMESSLGKPLGIAEMKWS